MHAGHPIERGRWADPRVVRSAGVTQGLYVRAILVDPRVDLISFDEQHPSAADTAALTTIILGVADAAARRELEALMASPKFHSTFVDGLLQQGEERGALTSKVEDLIKVIKARGLEVTKAQRNLIASCADLSQLATWFDQALEAKTADEIFGAR